jgi:hypothetical protein
MKLSVYTAINFEFGRDDPYTRHTAELSGPGQNRRRRAFVADVID